MWVMTSQDGLWPLRPINSPLKSRPHRTQKPQYLKKGVKLTLTIGGYAMKPTKTAWSTQGNFDSPESLPFWLLVCALCWLPAAVLLYLNTQTGNPNDGQLGLFAFPIVLFVVGVLPLCLVAATVALIVGLRTRCTLLCSVALLSLFATGSTVGYMYVQCTSQPLTFQAVSSPLNASRTVVQVRIAHPCNSHPRQIV